MLTAECTVLTTMKKIVLFMVLLHQHYYVHRDFLKNIVGIFTFVKKKLFFLEEMRNFDWGFQKKHSIMVLPLPQL